MKKLTTILLSALLAFSLAACGSRNQGAAGNAPEEAAAGNAGESASAAGADGTQESALEADGLKENAAGADGTEENTVTGGGTAESASGADSAAESSNILIAYFSVMETDGLDTVAGASRVAVDGEVMGNNEYIARLIQRETGGELFAIETVQEYPTTHDPLLEFAYNEKADDARPELAAQIENPDSYDVIFLGYPNWNADLPMPLYTFLEAYDFGGKTIIPFTTHGGSGFSRTIQTIAKLQPGADVVTDGLSISRNSVSAAESEVTDWVNGLGLN